MEITIAKIVCVILTVLSIVALLSCNGAVYDALEQFGIGNGSSQNDGNRKGLEFTSNGDGTYYVSGTGAF